MLSAVFTKITLVQYCFELYSVPMQFHLTCRAEAITILFLPMADFAGSNGFLRTTTKRRSVEAVSPKPIANGTLRFVSKEANLSDTKTLVDLFF